VRFGLWDFFGGKTEKISVRRNIFHDPFLNGNNRGLFPDKRKMFEEIIFYNNNIFHLEFVSILYYINKKFTMH